MTISIYSLQFIVFINTFSVVFVPGWGQEKIAPEGRDKENVWHIHKHGMENFDSFWEQIMADLDSNFNSNNKKDAIKDNFDGFVDVMTGLWAMKSFRGAISYKGTKCFILI